MVFQKGWLTVYEPPSSTTENKNRRACEGNLQAGKVEDGLMSVVLIADLFVVVVGSEQGRKGFAESTGRGAWRLLSLGIVTTTTRWACGWHVPSHSDLGLHPHNSPSEQRRK